MAIPKAFILRDWNSGINTATPGDKVLIVREGTNASGDHDINLSGVLRPGATVHCVQLHAKTLSAAAVLDSDAAVPGDVDVMTLIIASPYDLQNYGD